MEPEAATTAAGASTPTRGLDHVYYWVTDMDRSIRFYHGVLGLAVIRRDGDEWAEFDAGSARLALHSRGAGQGANPGGATAVFQVDDLDLAKATLSARGVEFGHEAEVKGFARFASFIDPDGNTLQIIEYEPSAGR
jgi:catechol 2,3-dioxygenase-like lactoylglutathione lyase family enzyme